MTVERSRVSTVRYVLGQDWIEGGKDYQDAQWVLLRARWHTELQAGGWRLCEEPKETTEYDEQEREVRLYARAMAEREVGNVFTAPVGTPPGDPGWKAVGYLTPGWRPSFR